MRLALWSVSLSLLLYVAGRPMQSEHLFHEAGGSYSVDMGEPSDAAIHQTSSSTTSSSTSVYYESVAVPGGQVFLTPELVNDIWATRDKAKQLTEDGKQILTHRVRRSRLGMKKGQLIPKHEKIGKISDEFKNLPAKVLRELRLKFMGVKPGEAIPAEYHRLQFEVLREADENYEKDPQRLNRHVEIMKSYARHEIKSGRVWIDLENQKLRPAHEKPMGKIGRPKLEVCSSATLRMRSYLARKAAQEQQDGRAAEQASHSASLPQRLRNDDIELDLNILPDVDEDDY